MASKINKKFVLVAGGFTAAVYHRGVPVVFVSTTLLGQIEGGFAASNRGEPPIEHKKVIDRTSKYHWLADSLVKVTGVIPMPLVRYTPTWSDELTYEPVA